MGTLYLDRKDASIRLDGGALALYAAGRREGIVPLSPIRCVVIAGNMHVETRVLARLAEMNITVVFLAGRSLAYAGTLQGRVHNNGLLRVRQYEASRSGFAIEYAGEIVRKKLTGQRDLLRSVALQRTSHETRLLRNAEIIGNALRSIERCSAISALRALEGGAAAAFFAAYTKVFAPALGFRSRKRRPPQDPVNALLSLTYTLLFREALREAQVIGLDPTIGFLHDFEYGRDSLACDLVEPYRPLAEELVWHFFRDRVFRKEDFMNCDEGCFLGKAGRKRFYTHYEQWASEIRPAIREEARELARRLMENGTKDTLS